MNGVDIELVVPSECQPGEVIYMDLLPEGFGFEAFGLAWEHGRAPVQAASPTLGLHRAPQLQINRCLAST